MSVSNDLAYLSYCSQAQSPTGQADLNRLLEVSRRNNQRDEITGLLTYSGELFVQFLEGPAEALHSLMDRLQGDSRHRDIIILSEGQQHERILPGWDMELVTRKQAHQVLRDALGAADTYVNVIGLTRLLARLAPDLHRTN
jgi:Sensors of blue-light using FAD